MSNENQYNSLDEIVFENKNKQYGAYDLRKKYPKILLKSSLIGAVIFLVIVLTPFVYVTVKRLTKPAPKEVKSVLINLETKEEPVLEQPEETPPPPPPPPKEEEPEQQEVIQNVVPEPKKDAVIETPPPPISKQTETTTGLVPQEGEKKVTYIPPPPSTGGTPGGTAEVKPQVSRTEIYEVVDQGAEFPGGINAFRNKFESMFDSESMEGEGSVKTTITFVVERDGTITDIEASGSNSAFNQEAIRTMKNIKNKWTPGKKQGQPVRSRFVFPVSMKFE